MKRLFVVAVFVYLACSHARRESKDAPRHVLTGAGASLPYPLYSVWASRYAQLEPAVRINYQAIGSGAGIREMADGVIDFGGTDEPIDERHGVRQAFVHVPTTVGAVVLAYNLDDEHVPLRLTPELVADLFLGKVTRWDDERVRRVNPALALPSAEVTIVHRADGSGTTAAMTAYLSKNSEQWRDSVGAGLLARFPVGVGARGNEGVAAFVKATPSAIGYVELAYARRASLQTAHVKNRAGIFVEPSLSSLEIALETVAEPGNGEASGEGAYPITALSFVILPREARDAGRSRALAKFLWWAIHEGQALAPTLDYAPLPPPLVSRAEQALRELRAGGDPVLPAGT